MRKKYTLNDLHDLATTKGGKCLSTIYVNFDAHYLWECSKGHKWKAIADSIKRGSWCPECSRLRRIDRNSNRRQSILSFIKKHLSKKSIHWIAHQLKKTPQNVRGICWQYNIPLLRRWTKQEDDELLKLSTLKSTKEISKILKRSIEAVNTRASRLKISLQSPSTPRKWDDSEIAFLRKWAIKKSSEWIGEKLNRTTTSVMSFASKKGISVDSVRIKPNKQELAHIKKWAGKKSVHDIAKDLQKKSFWIQSVAQKYKVSTKFTSIGSYHENEISIILDKLKIAYKREYRSFNCIRIKKSLPFDYYLPEFNLCIEFDGEQHFKMRTHGWFNPSKFKNIQKNDQFKNLFCKERGIKLIRIPYLLSDKIEEIITREHKKGFPRSLNYSEKLFSVSK
jgi:hypothetical protein